MFKKERYLYNVAYFHSNGNGCSQIIRNTTINSLQEFDSVRHFIEETNNLERVVIINYQLITTYWE